jgi:hypothetical protein
LDIKPKIFVAGTKNYFTELMEWVLGCAHLPSTPAKALLLKPKTLHCVWIKLLLVVGPGSLTALLLRNGIMLSGQKRSSMPWQAILRSSSNPRWVKEKFHEKQTMGINNTFIGR